MRNIDTSNAWVFVSHSNKDFEKIRYVRNKLEMYGFKPLLFFMKCLEDDKEIFELIKREIKARDRFLLCDSIHSRQSSWVQKEIEYIISLGRPYDIVNLEDSEEEINICIDRFVHRSTMYIWSTDDAIGNMVAKRLVDKSYVVEILPKWYLDDYFWFHHGASYSVDADFHDVVGNGYMLLIISHELTENERDRIDMVASGFRCALNTCLLYVASKEAMNNGELYYNLQNGDGIKPRIVCREALSERDNAGCADKIVEDVIALDCYHYNYTLKQNRKTGI